MLPKLTEALSSFDYMTSRTIKGDLKCEAGQGETMFFMFIVGEKQFLCVLRMKHFMFLKVFKNQVFNQSSTVFENLFAAL